jgi:DNA-binding beta-propeller fold protein YncE
VLVTPDAATVLLPELGRHELRIVDRGSREELARIGFPEAGPQGITLTPDARWAFMSLSAEARVVVIDMRSREVVRSIDAGERPDGVAYTPRTFTGS